MAQPRDRDERADELEISDMPELRRVAEEVARSGRIRVLKEHGKVIAEIVPQAARKSRSRRQQPPTQADLEAFRSAAGSWADVDTDKLIADIYASRDGRFPQS